MGGKDKLKACSQSWEFRLKVSVFVPGAYKRVQITRNVAHASTSNWWQSLRTKNLDKKTVKYQLLEPTQIGKNDCDIKLHSLWIPNCLHIATGCSEKRCNFAAIFFLHTGILKFVSFSVPPPGGTIENLHYMTNLQTFCCTMLYKNVTILNILVELCGINHC